MRHFLSTFYLHYIKLLNKITQQFFLKVFFILFLFFVLFFIFCYIYFFYFFFFNSFFLFEFDSFLLFFSLNCNFIGLDNFISSLTFIKFNSGLSYSNFFYEFLNFFRFPYDFSEYNDYVSFLRFPYFDDGGVVLYGNRFPYGFLGFGNLDCYWIRPFFAEKSLDDLFLIDYARLPMELTYPAADEIFVYNLWDFLGFARFDYNFDYDFCIKFIYHFCDSSFDEYLALGYDDDFLKYFFVDSSDLRNNFFWNTFYIIIPQVSLNDCYFYFFHYHLFSLLPDLQFIPFLNASVNRLQFSYFPFIFTELFFYLFLLVFLFYFYFFIVLRFFFRFFFILFRVICIIVHYVYYVLFYIFFGYYNLEDNEEGNSIFFTRHEPFYNSENWNHNGYDVLENIESLHEQEDISPDVDNKFFGFYYSFFFKAKPRFVYNFISNEFFFYFLDYFFTCLLRCFSFSFFFFYFLFIVVLFYYFYVLSFFIFYFFFFLILFCFLKN